ncbi:MAG: acetyl-CoA acetyltransferase [Chitinophagales bacterium]
MSRKVYILGGYQTDFSVNYAKNGHGIDQIIGDTIQGGLEASNLEEKDIDVFHIGNFIGELMAHQGHLGGFISELFPKFNNIPAFRHEAACASGGLAVLAGMTDILAGRYKTAAILGVEIEKNKSGDEAADHLGVAAWYDEECKNVKYPWPKLFSDVGDVYEERYGLDQKHLVEIGKTHFANAKTNQNAQTRKWVLEDKNFSNDNDYNPVITGRIRKQDCSQITDGGAIIFLANEEVASEFAFKNGKSLSDIPHIKGWGHTTGPITLQSKLERAKNSEVVFPHLKQCIDETFKRAEIKNVFELDGIETHDCFTTSAYMAIDHFGITAPGENWKAIEAGWLKKEGKLPLNASGGLIGGGHPVGATGVRMVLDAFKQVTNQANGYQIENCKNIGTLNIGGSVTTCVSFVVGR